MGNLKDYATGTVLTAPSPATSGTSLVLNSGEGARMPAVPFYATIHDPAVYPTLDNAEKIQVTAVSTDTLTIVRAQGSTSAQSIQVGWRLSNSVFLNDLLDFPTSSVDSEIVLFSSTTGRVLKRATTTGMLKAASGVLSAATEGTDFYKPGGTDVAVADGGTGSSTASGARTNLGLVIGTDVQAHDADLDTWATKTAPSGTVVGTSDTQELTNKTVTTPVIRAFDGWFDANESWSYSSASGAIGVITIPSGGTTKYTPGMRIKLTQTTVKYFVVVAVTSTTLTVWGGTDYTLANAAISVNYYTPMTYPVGFPANPDKWSIELLDATTGSTSPTTNTWYNLYSLSITLPVGCWDVYYEVLASATGSGAGNGTVFTTLSTANNSESDLSMTTRSYANVAAALVLNTVGRRKTYEVTSGTTVLYLNAKVDQASSALQYFSSNGKTRIKARLSYVPG